MFHGLIDKKFCIYAFISLDFEKEKNKEEVNTLQKKEQRYFYSSAIKIILKDQSLLLDQQVQYTIDTVITELSLDPEKRFIQVKRLL